MTPAVIAGLAKVARVWNYLNRTMGFSGLTQVRSHEGEVRAGNGAIVCTALRPLEVQAGSTFVVEILSPEGQGNLFVVGSISLGESSLSYISYILVFQGCRVRATVRNR